MGRIGSGPGRVGIGVQHAKTAFCCFPNETLTIMLYMSYAIFGVVSE